MTTTSERRSADGSDMTEKKRALGPGAKCCEDSSCALHPAPEMFTLDAVAEEFGLDEEDDE
jgi:hypothetical protein